MRPKEKSEYVDIPVAIDGGNAGIAQKKGKVFWTFILFGAWIFTSLIALLLGSGTAKILYPLISFFAFVWIVRFVVLQEVYYRKKREEIERNSYVYDYDVFWNIVEVSDSYPYIAQFANGRKGIFVAMDKDVIIGKGDLNDFDHYEAISQAYKQMVARGMECMHLDYMDTVGKDPRLDSLFAEAEGIENPDLKKVIMAKYEYLERLMSSSYSSYDVYCFYSYNRDDAFWKDVQPLLLQFMQANYLNARILDRDKIGSLVQALYGVEGFSVAKACDLLLSRTNNANFLKLIWTEVDGERTVHNRTQEEISEANRVSNNERMVKRKKRGVFGMFKKDKNEDIDFFD